MTYPKRMLEDEPTELERALLRAGRKERSSPEHRARLRALLGIGGWTRAMNTARKARRYAAIVVMGAAAAATVAFAARAMF